ncbi:beta-glucosidase family protein [Alteraurantiacibacter buctensis]|uniref:Glycosyl hydrolase n=1 Tax=Alteraurantiacibacter buctensis TaxID=1503981 RepID=A0A844Z1Y6_9SPHN|nr:beta-glucosidase [Alteraurantiacibacter buctensis]MXO73170.1 glycosyl hydrolase [Alteraurantiacibacter buctensis]
MPRTPRLTAATALALVMAAPFALPLAAQDASVTLAADTAGTPDERAATILAQMTQDEKLTLMMGYFGESFEPGNYIRHPEARPGSAGYVPGIPRLGIPGQWQTDAGIGVAMQGGAEVKHPRTALPSGLATAATWDRALAFAGGAMIGREARADGFNVMLAGGVNLLRDPRNGRNFEYAGEDPLLAGIMVGAQVAGIQSNHIIATSKHFAVNDQETDRSNGNSVIDEATMRMSDLLAFQLAHEAGNPGSVMCAYNRVNGPHACEAPFLLTQVLREEWGFPGFVMSDWGAVHSTAPSINAGLDQESGFGLQRDGWLGAERLRVALVAGEITQGQIDTAVHRILRTLFAYGLVEHPASASQAIDFAANRAVSQADAEAGIVLLKNERNLLPLAATARRIVVIGGHADAGVLSGGGSSQVYPEGGNAVPGLEPTSWPGPVVYYPSSPLAELRALLPEAEITYLDGRDHEAAAAAANTADLAIVFANQWASESIDVPAHVEDDTLVESVAMNQRNTVVVLQTGGPVLMPWADRVAAIVQAWYPGSMGGAAIARVLTGAVNPSGHLPATFPRSLDQLPNPSDPQAGDVVYGEGATVGYKWFDARGLEPLFPFGHGLSFTEFRYGGLSVSRAGEGLVATFTVTNTGQRAGADAAQVYISAEGWEAPQRLAAFAKVMLQPGETRQLSVAVDPRLLAVWDVANPGWRRAAGTYRVTVAHDSRHPAASVEVTLPASHLSPQWRPQ